jgi:hypothetical protein
MRAAGSTETSTNIIESVDVAATLYTHISKVLGWNRCQDKAIFTEIIRGFSQSLQTNTGVVPLLDHDSFL